MKERTKVDGCTPHPLINPQSTHYIKDGKQSIEEIENELSVDGMIAACTFNIRKYSLRLESKGQKESDLKKIETYENYKALLLEMKSKFDCRHMPVAVAYRYCHIQIDYGA